MVMVVIVMVMMMMMVMVTMEVFDRLWKFDHRLCVTRSTHGDKVGIPCMRPAQVIRQVAGGCLWDGDERRGETLRSGRE